MNEITIERRTLLWLPFAMAGGALLRAAPIAAGSAQEAAAKSEEPGALTPLTFEEFGPRWLALATELKALPKERDESYAAQLCGLIARVPIDLLPKLAPTPGIGRGAPLVGGPSWSLLPCVTIEFTMQPGAAIRPHNHPPQVVATLCAAGEVAYRHFELHGEAPPCTKIDGTEFEIRETRSGLLAPGSMTTLTRARDGIHGFVAGDDGARILDFTVGLTPDLSTFSYLEVTPDPIDRDQRIYGAVWRGKGR